MNFWIFRALHQKSCRGQQPHRTQKAQVLIRGARVLVTSRILTQACSSFLLGEGQPSPTRGPPRKALEKWNELPEDDSRTSLEEASEPSVGGRPETWEKRAWGETRRRQRGNRNS